MRAGRKLYEAKVRQQRDSKQDRSYDKLRYQEADGFESIYEKGNLKTITVSRELCG